MSGVLRVATHGVTIDVVFWPIVYRDIYVVPSQLPLNISVTGARFPQTMTVLTGS